MIVPRRVQIITPVHNDKLYGDREFVALRFLVTTHGLHEDDDRLTVLLPIETFRELVRRFIAREFETGAARMSPHVRDALEKAIKPVEPGDLPTIIDFEIPDDFRPKEGS